MTARLEGILDRRSVVVTFHPDNPLLRVEHVETGQATISVGVDEQTVAFEIDASSVRSGRWVVSFGPAQRAQAERLDDSVNAAIHGSVDQS